MGQGVPYVSNKIDTIKLRKWVLGIKKIYVQSQLLEILIILHSVIYNQATNEDLWNCTIMVKMRLKLNELWHDFPNSRSQYWHTENINNIYCLLHQEKEREE